MRSNVVTLNTEQLAVVNAHDGVWTVIASPGSGKTTTLISRYLEMLKAGISPKDILNLTFTNAAAAELSSRVGILGADSVFRTFHSFALEILRKEREHLPFKLSETIIPVAMEDYQLLFDLVKIYPAINWRTLQERITGWKCANILPDQAIEESRHNGIEYFYGLAYRDYELKSRERGFLDFDSLMRETVGLLERNEDVRNRWKREYISIDEAQDTDAVQVDFIRLLFDGNLMICGDFNQAIFEWRSAKPNSLTDFARTLPGHKVLFLSQNFRSTKALVSFFKDILPVDNGIMSVMKSENEEGEPPVITRYLDADQEANKILGSIADPINTAILARTNRQLFTFQRLCMSRGIKYKILGKRDYFEQNEIKKVLGFAKAIKDDPRTADAVLSEIVRQHNLFHLYQHSETLESSPIENINNLIKMSIGKGSISDFLDWIRKLMHARRSAKGIVLSTGHQAKGRQFDNVFVIGAKQGLLPHQKAEIEEERRLFFVMCTRAAKKLTISFYDNPSEFIPRTHLNGLSLH